MNYGLSIMPRVLYSNLENVPYVINNQLKYYTGKDSEPTPVS